MVRLKRVRVTFPACHQPVEAVARDGPVRGYCAAAGRYVDFPVEEESVLSAGMKRLWPDPDYRARIEAMKSR